ncbi:30S ribosomal protein S23 [Mesotoga sp. HF07.pep.5.2.highcov]|uniref:four helix bundle protein n=1 Tax=Mesotoga sp. HF07.pep.5.2.highcov TaxID=1462923 RepID=UPI000EF1628E|nr:four helix bundle protein [Mesotoga sp. HF07.pep.5.2.highcov]RLL91177.1 30S ribosomal protein S23 [Mesotoga sp. HF07.pep.5.2.highcov]
MSLSNLEVWRKSVELAKKIYFITKDFPQSEIYGLTSQMRRASVSIASNIAEGRGRSTAKDFVHFLHLAQGSLYELSTQLVIAHEVGLLNNEHFEDASEEIRSIESMIRGLIFRIRNEKK